MSKTFKTQVNFEGGLKMSGGVLSVNERTQTPGHDIGEIKIYGKTDNKLYYLNENGVEHELAASAANFLEVYVFENTVATTIETANTPIALSLSATIEGETGGDWTVVTGSTGTITAYSDYSGTVAGSVLVTSTAHGLTTDDIISIRGTTNYNGIFDITVVDVNSFYITATWVADDGASDWDQGDHAIVGTGSEGKYKLNAIFTVSENGAAGSTVRIFQYINSTRIDKAISGRKFSNNDIGSMSLQGILNLTVGDKVFLTIESSGTNTISIEYLNLILKRI